MSRYGIGSESEDDFEPGSKGLVLRNLLGITDPQEAGLAESRALRRAFEESQQWFTDETTFRFDDLRRMHQFWLGDIYKWAGEIRTVNLTKAGITFAPAAYLDQSIKDFEELLRQQTPCKPGDINLIVHSIATVHVEFILLHPFREGNGRLGRWLADLMALQAALPPLDWDFENQTEEKRDAYFSALRFGFSQNSSKLEALMLSALDRSSQAPNP